jgi:predicted dithiol-disulfide oxidoreductase (DUF899 family)
MTKHQVVSREEWIAARQDLRELEREHARSGNALRQQRLELPWTRVEREYLFDTAGGRQTLAELFDGRGQLIVQHFMLGPGWNEGCSGCSFLADHMPGALVHLENHDVSFVAVSRAPLDEIQRFQRRMGWPFRWVSSYGSSFNTDFHVSFTEPDIAAGKSFSYNYAPISPESDLELPGLSSFFKDKDGTIYHTYSTYARGGDQLLNAYNYLDLTPKGRNEVEIMDWMKLHDQYEVAEPALP